MYFDELDLNDNVLDALYDMRFDTCTPVQEKCIPEILEGHDVLGVAQTGTGKTAAYLLPVLSKLDDGGYPKDANLQALQEHDRRDNPSGIGTHREQTCR